MKKTLLSALKHGSGTIFILLSMMLGGSLQAWGGTLPRNQEYYFHFENSTPISDQQIISSESSDKNHYTCSFIVPGSSSSYNFTIYCSSNGNYYRKADANFNESSETKTDINSTSGNQMKLTPIVSSGYVQIDVDMYCTYDSESRLTISQTAVRYFSAGEYIYFVNGKGYPYSGGTIKDDNWVMSGHYAGIKLTMSDETTQYAWFSYYSGSSEGTTGSIYRAQISTAGYCKSFVITRNDTNNSGGDPTESGKYWNKTDGLTYNSTNVGYNTITKTASSGTDWTGNYTSYCNAPTPSTGSASSITATTVTLGATVAAAASNPCTPTYVGVNVYSDASCETLVTSGQTAFTNYAATYSIGITSLSPKTTYYYKAYVISDEGTTESASSSSFTTGCLSGVATTNPSTSTQTVCLGSATALSVTASGGPGSGYTYQWYYNSTASTTGAVAIPGATFSSYTPAVVGENYYYCSVGAAGGYCDVNSELSGKITIKGVPVVSASASSVTNYVPVTLTATGVESTNWSITSGAGGYLYDTNATTVKFKGNVGSSSTPVTYTIQATSDGCSGTVNVTVSRNSDNCQ